MLYLNLPAYTLIFCGLAGFGTPSAGMFVAMMTATLLLPAVCLSPFSRLHLHRRSPAFCAFLKMSYHCIDLRVSCCLLTCSILVLGHYTGWITGFAFHFRSLRFLFSVDSLCVIRSSERARSVFPLLHEHAELCIRELKQIGALLEGKKREEEGSKEARVKDGREEELV